MPLPKTSGELRELLLAARKDFFREAGDSANSVILDRATFGWVVPECSADDRGRPLFSVLVVVFAECPGSPVLLAKTMDPLNECESCRGL